MMMLTSPCWIASARAPSRSSRKKQPQQRGAAVTPLQQKTSNYGTGSPSPVVAMRPSGGISGRATRHSAGAAVRTRMCIQQPVSFTDLFVAQQITVLPTPAFAASNGLLDALDAPKGIPAVVAGAASPGFVQVKLHATNQHMQVPLDMIRPADLSDLIAGDFVKRAMLNLEEEDATVLRVNSAQTATIKLTNGTIYQTMSYRLRKVGAAGSSSGLLTPSQQQQLGAGVGIAVSPELLDPERIKTGEGFRQLFSAFAAAPPTSQHSALDALLRRAYPTGVAETVEVNRLAFEEPALRDPFLNTVASAPAPVFVDLLLHGTAGTNVKNIFSQSLVSKRSCGSCWFTRDPGTARGYSSSGDAVVCAVIHGPEGRGQTILTTTKKEMHLPLAHVKLSG